jgi:hypothetical protein
MKPSIALLALVLFPLATRADDPLRHGQPRAAQRPVDDVYFYVPRGTRVIGGFSDGPGELHNPDGKSVHTFSDAPGYFSIPVPAGQDAKLWRFNHGNGRRLLMTVPPYLTRSAKELLLPREVVERDMTR